MRFTHERLHGGASSEAPLLHVFHVDTLQEFSYNEHGGVVRSVLRHADAQTPQIVSGTAYQHNGNHILSQTDARGKTVTHDIDENTDLTRAVTDPNGQQVQYAYTTGTPGTVQQIVSYAYGDADWKDKLTRFNGVDIAYDAIGNPIHDGVWAYTWENGRQLRRMACDATIAEFVYNADGLRVQKTVNGVATNYTLHGKNIVHMTKGNAELHFWYDAQNRPAIVEFNGTKYGYLYNLQGDVIGLIDSANTEVVKYTYDAWGKPLSVTGSLANTIGYYNPFRYRGYVYDVETGLYYLRSRYYNPRWGRFVNADANIGHSQGIISHNIMAYCCNRPINNFDPDGKWLLFASMCALLGGILYVDHKIANMPGLTEEEKLVARAHPIEAAIAKKASDVAGELTNTYWGKNATNYDATTANAFKHAVWNALMTRDLGSSMAYDFATAHEYSSYGDMSPYQMWYDASIVITIHDGTVMDLINNERGRTVGQSVPFYYSNDQVAQAVIADMLANPEAYCVLVDNYCMTPIQ